LKVNFDSNLDIYKQVVELKSQAILILQVLIKAFLIKAMKNLLIGRKISTRPVLYLRKAMIQMQLENP